MSAVQSGSLGGARKHIFRAWLKAHRPCSGITMHVAGKEGRRVGDHRYESHWHRFVTGAGLEATSCENLSRLEGGAKRRVCGMEVYMLMSFLSQKITTIRRKIVHLAIYHPPSESCSSTRCADHPVAYPAFIKRNIEYKPCTVSISYRSGPFLTGFGLTSMAENAFVSLARSPHSTSLFKKRLFRRQLSSTAYWRF